MDFEIFFDLRHVLLGFMTTPLPDGRRVYSLGLLFVSISLVV